MRRQGPDRTADKENDGKDEDGGGTLREIFRVVGAALPLTGDERRTVWNTGVKVFGRAVFAQLPVRLQDKLRRLHAHRERSL